MDLRRTLERGLVSPLLALKEPALARVVQQLGGPPDTRGVAMDLRASLLLHLDRRLHVPLERMSPAKARIEAHRRAAVTLGEPPDGVHIEEVRLDHPELSNGLRALVHRPRFPGRGPLIVFFHEGGFVLGSPEWTTPLAGVLVGLLGARVVSVEYRRAPEHPVPVIQKDALAAVRAARARAPEWGADANGWVVVGASAGGHLSAWLAQGLPIEERPAVQVLIYPYLDRVVETRARTEFGHAHPVSDAFIGWSEAHAFPDDMDPFSPDASPARKQNLGGLPPALVVTSGFDPLLDDGDEYARRLREAQVPVRHRRYLELPHGFLLLGGAVPAAGAAMRQIARDVGVMLQAAEARACPAAP